MDLKPTPEQELIIEDLRHDGPSINVDALAGCAKSSTLKLGLSVKRPEPTLLLVFNVKNRKDLEGSVPEWVQVKTLNGLGHAAWQRAIGKRCEIDDRKIGKAVTQAAKDLGIELGIDGWTNVRQLVTAAMTAGLVPSMGLPYAGLVEDTPDSWRTLAEDAWLDPREDHAEVAREALRLSIKASIGGTICFDDQIYCSALLGGQFPKFPFVGVDEAQDLSPINHLQVNRCLAPNSRLMPVGDPNQAIYGWRGASHDSMQRLRALRSEWLDRKLTMTFRVPKLLVERQREFVPGFRAAPWNPDGALMRLRRPVDWTGDRWTWSWQSVLDQMLREDRAAVICRNNAPLLSLAFKLIRQGIGVVMLGRDIGKGLVALATKIIPEDSTSPERCMGLVRDWADSQIALALANEQEAKAEKISDQAECLVAVIEGGIRDAADLRARLRDLFSRERGLVELSSGHRAKGLEWEVVVHLDPWRIPSKWARKQADAGDPRSLIQENNLRYVIETRSKRVLILANLEDFA